MGVLDPKARWGRCIRTRDAARRGREAMQAPWCGGDRMGLSGAGLLPRPDRGRDGALGLLLVLQEPFAGLELDRAHAACERLREQGILFEPGTRTR